MKKLKTIIKFNGEIFGFRKIIFLFTIFLFCLNFNYVKADSDTKLTDVNKINAPEIIAKNAVVYDVKNKDFLYAKNAEESVPIASLAKIITAAEFIKFNSARLKAGNPIEKVQIIKKGQGYNKGDKELINGEVWKTENLIRYMLMTSSNIAAQSLVNSLIDDEFAFSLLMNRDVKDLGFKSFSFKNVSGLSIDNPDYNSKLASSTPSIPKQIPSDLGNAKEVSVLFNSIFASVPFIEQSSIIPEASFINWSGNTHTVKNVNLALTTIPNVIAGKTGTTEESGGNVIIVENINNNRYVILIMGSTIESRYEDLQKLSSSTQAFATSK